MRKSTPAISLAMAWNAPPRTRRVTGSISTRSRVGGPGRDHRGRVVLVHDRGSLQAVAGLQSGTVVVHGRDLLQLSLHPEPRGPLVAQGILGSLLVPALDLGVLERRHEADPAHADVRDLDVGVLEAARVLPLVDVVEVGAQLLGPDLV